MIGLIDELLHVAIMICTKGNKTFVASGSVAFFRCLWWLATIFNAGNALVVTVWPARRCLVRKRADSEAGLLNVPLVELGGGTALPITG